MEDIVLYTLGRTTAYGRDFPSSFVFVLGQAPGGSI